MDFLKVNAKNAGPEVRDDMNLSSISHFHKDARLWVWFVKCLLNIHLWPTMVDNFHFCDLYVGCFKPSKHNVNATRMYIFYLGNGFI